MANQQIIPYKFDADSKRRFLEELSQTGRKFHSAAVANISMMTVRAHLDDDPEFQEAYEDALGIYAESVAHEVRRRAFGYKKPVFHQGQQGMTFALDEEGMPIYQSRWFKEDSLPILPPNAVLTGERDEEGRVEVRFPKLIPAFVMEYSDRMLELEAKRVDPSYRDKGMMDVNVKGGILVVPGMASEADFEAKYSQEKQLEKLNGEEGTVGNGAREPSHTRR